MMNQEGSQRLPQDDEQISNQQEREPKRTASCGVKLMIGYLYFSQGFLLSIPGTVPYIYPQLPDYFTLSLFSLSALPFSLKFLVAPILQRYSNIQYGKRKTWIIFSQVLTFLSLLILSFITDQSQAQKFALIGFFMYLGLTLQDISLDALSLKQLGSSKQMSTIQAGSQSSGIIIGGLILLKLTSLQFAQSINLQKPITNLQTLLIIVVVFLLIPSVLIHFLFQQIHLQSDQRTHKQSILKIYSIYKYFFKCGYRYFYVLVFMLVYSQGFNFFSAGYSYQLIEKGFSKNTLNTIDNIQSAIISLLIFIMGKNTYRLGYKKSFLIITSLTMVIYVYAWIFFPIDLWNIIFISSSTGIISMWDFLMTSAMIGDFPDYGATGMLMTMSSSSCNLGRNLFIHTAILKKLPWKWVSLGGLVLQLGLIIFFIPKTIDLINKGETKIQLSNQQTQLINTNKLEIQQKNETTFPK